MVIDGRRSEPAAAEGAESVRSFVSTDVTMPVLTATRSGATAPGKIFVDSQQSGTQVAMIVDDRGEPYWIRPADSGILNVHPQKLDGRTVLAYWDGDAIGGFGAGTMRILDSSYGTLHSIDTLGGEPVDLHENQLTDDGTLLALAQVVRRADLSAIGGPADGWLRDCHVYEVDLKSGAATRRWVASDDIDLDESYLGLDDDEKLNGSSRDTPYDAYHVNSVQAYGDSLLLSVRHTHALCSVHRTSGALQWRMGGKRSDFDIAADAAFEWQHHARWRSDTELALFDNHTRSGADLSVSSAKFLTVDLTARTVKLRRALRRDDTSGPSEGSVAPAGDGHEIVSFGSGDRVTEFDADGNPVLDITGFHATYRAYRTDWVGRPSTLPDIATRSAGNGRMRVYASWNGATEVVAWEVLAGQTPTALRRVRRMRRSGFESTALIRRADHVAVRALDRDGTVLATSKTVQTAT